MSDKRRKKSGANESRINDAKTDTGKAPGMKQEKTGKAGSMETFRKVLRVIGGYRILLAFSILLAAVSTIVQLAIPLLFGDAIDAMVSKGNVDFETVRFYLGRILVMLLICGTATWLMSLVNNRLTYGVVQDIRRRAIRKLQVLPLSYLDSHSTGDLVSRMVADATLLSDGLLLGFTQLFSGVIAIVVTLGFMISKSVLITAVVLVLTPVSFFVAKFIASRSFQMFLKQSEARGQQTALIEEMIGNQKLVQAFGYEKKSSERFAQVNQKLREYSQRAVFYSSLTNPSTRFVNNVIYALVALIGAFLILAGNLTVGGLSVLLSYANQYMKPFNDISSVVTELQNAMACAARIFEFLEEPEESRDPKEELPAAHGRVQVSHVDFSYDPSRPLIEDFSLDVKPGMRVAIVGPTGCGKTTFINLLMRFYDVDRGKILVDGKAVTEISRHSLRENYGMVLQDTWLKNGTVRDNIRFGRPDADDEEILKAAGEAKSLEFIRRLPEGLDTVLTEDSLSQGQKQLLCITRVMLCHPPMLILDEATSSIDTRTEIQIQQAFDRLMEGRTSFIVAHRLSTIRNADLILVMKDGKIVERGNHEELLKEDGLYRSLYNSMSAG